MVNYGKIPFYYIMLQLCCHSREHYLKRYLELGINLVGSYIFLKSFKNHNINRKNNCNRVSDFIFGVWSLTPFRTHLPLLLYHLGKLIRKFTHAPCFAQAGSLNFATLQPRLWNFFLVPSPSHL